MAWKHGQKPAQRLWLRRKEMDMENQLEAHWRGATLIVIGGESYPNRLVVEAVLDRVHRQRGFKRVILNDLPNISNWTQNWARHERVEFTLIANCRNKLVEQREHPHLPLGMR